MLAARADYWAVLALLLFVALSFVLAFRAMLRQCPVISRRARVLLVLIVLLAVALRFLVMPAQHNVFYDEFLHLDVARVAYENQAFGELRTETPGGEPRTYVLPWWPPGYHVLLSSWWHVTGRSEGAAFCLSRVLGTVSVALAFLLGLLMFADEKAGLWTALLLAAYPLHVKFSSGTSLEVTSVFFLLLMLCVLTSFVREPTAFAGMATLAAAAYYVLVRPENLLLGVPLVLYVSSGCWKTRPRWWQRLLLAAAVAALLAPGLYHGWHRAFVLSHVAEQTSFPLIDNLLFWVASPLHPAAYSLLALLGVVTWTGGRKAVGVMAACFLVLVLFHVFVHRSSFLLIDYGRFALNFSLVVVLGATAGILWLTGRHPRSAVPMVGVVAASLAIGSHQMVQPYRDLLEHEVAFVRQATPGLPAGCLVFAAGPAYNRVLQDVAADDLGFLFDSDARIRLAGSQRPLVLFVDVPTSKDRGGLFLKLHESGWQATALETTEIEGSEIGFYQLRLAVTPEGTAGTRRAR